MKPLFLVSATIIVLGMTPAFAKDQQVTDAERTKLVAAVAAQSCEGGKMERDTDGSYDVDDVRCSDGRKYDLEFDSSFNLIKKKLDD